MKCVIVSDVHDNLANLDKFLKYLQQENINTILCCGDLGSQKTLDYLYQHYWGKIWAVSGNLDRDMETKLPEIQEIILDDKKIALVHEPEKATKLAQTGKYDLIFYGHTHKPWIEKFKIKNLKLKIVDMVNPGNLTGILYQPTFAIYDTRSNKLELKILNELKGKNDSKRI
ncbi:MAG: YfcE family phosphodiesterase [Patescibacteria group bacterium]|nr:YfcE family phosphodiesterase [Patescibacteria group bacterium]